MLYIMHFNSKFDITSFVNFLSITEKKISFYQYNIIILYNTELLDIRVS